MYSNIVDILEYDQFRIRLSKYERKKEREGTRERERGRERCASSELSEFSRNDLS